MFSFFNLFFSSVSVMTSGTFFTANLNTACPSICMKCSSSNTVSLSIFFVRPFASCLLFSVSAFPLFPSECVTGKYILSVVISSFCASYACTTAAPAPSPNKMHVPRSSQFVRFDRLSLPITSTVRYIPAAI